MHIARKLAIVLALAASVLTFAPASPLSPLSPATPAHASYFFNGSGYVKYCANGDCSNTEAVLEVTVYFEYNFLGQAYTTNIVCSAWVGEYGYASVTWKGTVNNGAGPPLDYASAGCNWSFRVSMFGGYHKAWERVDFDSSGFWTTEKYDDCGGKCL